ncbi:serpin family protein [Patescibacteria group bacterium]|nr:serpin family protein [Patescibacteria group bacterium]MBU1663090.1 serpin family protein [Patescibacteria group bacterium]MBU1934057.1 serpin family protein [Patescibacteria group bacterium]MBU2263896.1 serpin family protein [Patescibacteria group bacterium]
MSKKFLLTGGIILFAGIATAAALFLFPYEPKQPPKADDTGSTSQGVQEVVNANNKFTFNLYSELKKSESGNIFYSPYSISAALTMTYEGAKGQTADEMKSVFHFPEISTLRPNFAAIYNKINKGAKDYELRTGNALWVQQNYPLLEDYTNRVEKYYGGKAANLDFAKETEKSRQTINSFIEEQTNNKIKDLIPSGVLNSLTRLVLTNAIYFKGTWEWEFDKSNTREQDFKITPSNVVKTPMMYMKPKKARFNYSDLEDLQILELPYKGGKISMLILLPTENLDSIEPALTAEKLSEYKSQMQETKLDAIYLPKFEFDTKYTLNENLKALGMPTAFDLSSADFSGMTTTEKIWIDFVIHQAYVKVDEKGTEAAAATAVSGMIGSAMPRNVFKADHPFIFLIQEKDTGNILFLGRVVNPTL